MYNLFNLTSKSNFLSQSAFIYSKLPMETLEQSVKYVQS